MPAQRRPSPRPARPAPSSLNYPTQDDLFDPLLQQRINADNSSPQQKQNKARPPRTRRIHRYFTLRYHIQLISRLAPKLLSLLFHGTPRWLFKLIRLICFVIALLPGFVVFAYYYFWSADRIAVPYRDGTQRTSRHFLDVYGSQTPLRGSESSNNEDANEGGKPVVIFLTGGAWIIGYKMWGALLARVLVPHGVLVIIPDYRNFPQVTVADMVHDVDESIQWTLDNCHTYGGDPGKVAVVGQSAGAHLGSCVLLRKAIDELKGENAQNSLDTLPTRYKANDIRGFLAASGPYNVVAMQDIFHQHGLDRNIVAALFGNDLDRHSPIHLIEECKSLATIRGKGGAEKDEQALTTLGSVLPPFYIVHGTSDKTVPYAGAIEYTDCLKNAGFRVQSKYYQDWSHTDPIIESPMLGDHIFHRDVYDFALSSCGQLNNGSSGEFNQFDETLPACEPICVGPLVSLGRFFNPF